ncbi:ninein-like protein isoform X2 [Betta splendens]|uniref:Ninein-like protein isoform X2 n=1 Tax=Betta splendens TaxID=158456 RepID=A0A6P7KKZ0_BETSP|nr:ninein-like protein isoform X2 [Betta splendens]
MEEAEHSHYVAQLKAQFDSCDTTATGFLDREELTVLCHKLQLEAHLPLLLDTLLGQRTYARVNFEEFKQGFVAVLSRSLDFSTSEDDSSYLEPVVPEEVKPKFVKGTKRYGRRSRPDSKSGAAQTCCSMDSPPSGAEVTDSSLAGVPRAKLRRSTSLESVESLKSDEEPGSQKENAPPDIQSKGEVELTAPDNLDLQQLNTEFQMVLSGSAPISCSTPVRPTDLQKALQRAAIEEGSVRSTSPSLLMATVGQRVLSCMDDGSGCTSPEQVIALWSEEGIRNSSNILQTLDFPLDERLNLAELTLALDNELLVSGNGIHQAALISYKNEIQHLQCVAEQACRERDKVKADLDLADQRNLKLVREVDDRHASMETLNQSRIRELEQDFRDRLTALRTQFEQEIEAQLQQVDRERSTLQGELQLLRAQEAELQEELCSATQENSRLEEELNVIKLKLTEAQSSVIRLQRDLDQLLHDKFGSLDAAGSGLSHEERFCEIIRESELQCRELRDRNDELSAELELVKSQRINRRFRTSVDATALSWTQDSDSDDSDMKWRSSPLVERILQPIDKTALCSLDSVSDPAVSIQTELALEQLKQNHTQELQQLNIQLETQMNYYERSLELMRQSMEVERKDISQAFKLEISELEDQKAQAEQQVKQLKETLDKLQTQMHHGGGWSTEQERRVQRERAELEQNFAKEISNLVQRLSAEKDQLEAELKLKLDQEVILVRQESEQLLSQMKLQQAKGCHILHQQLQEQRAFWESRLVQSEQERLQREASDKRRMEELHEHEVCQLKEQVFRLQEDEQNSSLQLSQLKGSLEEVKQSCGRLEDSLKASHGRCSELEAMLEEKTNFLESYEVLSKRCCELQLVKDWEGQLLLQVTHLKDEVKNFQATSNKVLQDEEVMADNCSMLAQQQVRLKARDQTVTALRSELESLHAAMTTNTNLASKLTAEMDLLKADRSRLIQDLKDQAMAVDKLQLDLDRVTEELKRSRSSEEGLQQALMQEQSKTSQLQCSLADEEEEVDRLSQENRSYTRLSDQLSTQIVEMEEEITTLREHLRDLSSQLNNTADLVLDLRKKLNCKTSEVERLWGEVAGGALLLCKATSSSEKQHSEVQQLTVQLEARGGELDQVREQVCQLQQALQNCLTRLRLTEENFEQEKRKLTQQLVELEELVVALEVAMDPASQHRTQLEEVRSENRALQERLSILQQEVQSLEEVVDKKRRKLEELEREHEQSRAEEERLHTENSKYREEVLDLSSRNLQLSSNNAELSACLRGDQESVQMLQEHLATVSKEQEEDRATVQRLQDAAVRQEREKLQQQAETQLLERELGSYKDKVSRLEVELGSVTLKQHQLELNKTKLLREADDRNQKVEKLQQTVLSLESELELLRSQLQAGVQEKLVHSLEVTDLQRKLHDAHIKMEALDTSVRKQMREKEELHELLEKRGEQASFALQQETHKLQVQNQELQHKLSQLQVQGLEVQKLTQEQQNLKNKLDELETARTKAQHQALRADAALGLVQAQQVRHLQELKERVGDGHREQVELLQAQLLEEQRRSQQLEETLRLQAQQSSSQISIKQDQYEKAMSALQQSTEDLEVKLKGAQMVLQEKAQQLKEQLVKGTKMSALLKDLYVENSQLMKALQVTEQRQKHAEKKNFLLEAKINALNKLLRELVPAALAT